MKEHEQKEFERLQRLADELDRHPATIQQREKEAAETLAKRKAATDRIEALNIDMAACGVIDREIDELILTLADMDKEREKVKNQINQKRGFLMREKSGIEGEIRREQQILLSCYDLAIDEAITFFNEKLNWLRSPGRITHVKTGSETNIFTEKVTVKEESNVDAINSALRYCQDAIKILEAMKLCPAVDLPGIEALKAGIPSIEIYKQVEGERPMTKGPDVGFLARMAHDLDLNIQRLLTKRI